MSRKGTSAGKLRIGDDWNAIRIIALSQSNPLKAIAEFVENSIDARARTVTITRGRERGDPYLAVHDDGDGIPRDPDGRPDFKYVATHICDSIKRKLKVDGGGGGKGIQGEFGIGLLSFWTVGERLRITSTGTDQRAYQMTMSRGDPAFQVAPRRLLFAERGTELRIAPLLEGVRRINGERIQRYLAAELRDRIRSSGVRITVVDKLARKQFAVEPRQFEGRLLHQLPAVQTPFGEIEAELYLGEPAASSRVGLYRSGTRVLEDVASLPGLERVPWTSGYLQGLLDASFLTLTPGTRSGLIHDERLVAFCSALEPLEERLLALIEDQRRAEEEQASRQLLRSIQRAFREAMLALPPEEYDWFDIRARSQRAAATSGSAESGAGDETAPPDELLGATGSSTAAPGSQREFFEHAGPLFSAIVSPAASTVAVGTTRRFKALPRDRSRRRVEQGLAFEWRIAEGGGALDGEHSSEVDFRAPGVPGLTRLAVTVSQGDVRCEAEALVTVTDTLESAVGTGVASARGLPGYTFQRAAGELWRSRFDDERNLIEVNSGHRDFVFAARSQALKLRYLVRLYVKELVLLNFDGLPPGELLERMIELSLYTEEKL